MRHLKPHIAALLLCSHTLIACEASVTVANMPGHQPQAPTPEQPQQPQQPITPELPTTPINLDRAKHREELAALSPEQAYAYLSRMAPMLAQRALNTQELDAINQDGGAAIAPMISAWVDAPAFAEAARAMIQLKLSTSGQTDKINFELPGNLAAYIVRERLPLHTLLTADYCIDDDGAQIDCDTDAPYKAGVLVTRAYMAANASRFNLHRAATMLKTFACMGYPMDQAIQPSLEREELIPMFQVVNEAEDVTGGFGNGFACYSCHSQFGAHAQLFVKFDSEGKWRAAAVGAQDPNGELGRSLGNLYASHMDNPLKARREESQMFGQQVDHLGQAAKILTESPQFLSCSTRNLIEFAFSLDESQAKTIPTTLLDDIATLAIEDDGQEPTLSSLAKETFSHPAVVKVITSSL